MARKLYIAVRETAPFETDEGKGGAEGLRDQILTGLGETLSSNGLGQPAGTANVTVKFGAENGRADAFTIVGPTPEAASIVRQMLAAADNPDLGEFALAAVFDVAEPMIAESLAWDLAYKLGAQDQIALQFTDEDSADGTADLETSNDKSIEIYYNVADIPGGQDPLEFRNAAMDVIERALMDAGAGDWAGADSGMGEINFGFDVEDFERAEKIVRAAVKGTPYEGIREITRYSDADGFAAA